MPSWIDKNEKDLLWWIQKHKSRGFGLFVVYADTLPDPFGKTGYFGRKIPGVTVTELRNFWEQNTNP